MADKNVKAKFSLSDGGEVTLDLYRLKAKDIRKWSAHNGAVPASEVMEAVAIATGLTVEQIDDMPAPDFLPIMTAFGEMMKSIASPNSA